MRKWQYLEKELRVKGISFVVLKEEKKLIFILNGNCSVEKKEVDDEEREESFPRSGSLTRQERVGTSVAGKAKCKGPDAGGLVNVRVEASGSPLDYLFS